MVLIPFKITIHDERERRFPYSKEVGPFWLDVPNDEIAAPVPPDMPGAHWEHVLRVEKWAKERLLADVECSIDVDALVGPQNSGDEARPAQQSERKTP